MCAFPDDVRIHMMKMVCKYFVVGTVAVKAEIVLGCFELPYLQPVDCSHLG